MDRFENCFIQLLISIISQYSQRFSEISIEKTTFQEFQSYKDPQSYENNALISQTRQSFDLTNQIFFQPKT